MSISVLKFPGKPKTKHKVIEIGVSGGWVGGYMERHNWAGTTLPFPLLCVIFYWQAANPNMPYFRVHEYTHVAQNEARASFVVAIVAYVWQMLKNFPYKLVLTRKASISSALFADYMANKYEVAAYAVEDDAFKNGLPDWAKL